MSKVVIIDYGLGNLFSIRQALLHVGAEVQISKIEDDIARADGILLPGVGAFGSAIERLKERDLIRVIREMSDKGRPVLGVCLGMQLLFQKSFEFGEHDGLGLLKGSVQKIPSDACNESTTIPFIGWNGLEISKAKEGDPFLRGIVSGSKIYFVHSFYVVPDETEVVLSRSRYGGFSFPSIVRKEHISGIQGHPEKSGDVGLEIYRNWLKTL